MHLETPSYIDQLNKFIKKINTKRDQILVLEAGCGSGSRFDFGAKAYIVGVDISLEQLHQNTIVYKKVLGDIQTIRLQPSSFDVIVCWDVLEHLPSPEVALKNFSEILKNDGIVIIGVPNVMSLKGLITKFTSYKFHCWVYRHIYKFKNAPFPTYHNWNLSPRSLISFANHNDLTVQWFHLDDRWVKAIKDKSLLVYAIYLGAGLIAKALTFGKISITRTECIVVYRKG